MTKLRWDGHLPPHLGQWPWANETELDFFCRLMATDAFGRSVWVEVVS